MWYIFVISVFSIFIVRKVIELILSSASFSKTEVELSQEWLWEEGGIGNTRNLLSQLRNQLRNLHWQNLFDVTILDHESIEGLQLLGKVLKDKMQLISGNFNA